MPLCFSLLQYVPELSWRSLPLLLTFNSGVVGLPALMLAAVCLAIGPLRRFGPTRWLGYVSGAIAVLFLLGPLLLMGQTALFLGSEQASLMRRTHTLKHDTTYDGVVYPAGSTVVLRKDSNAVESGTLSRPTVLKGLLMGGKFSQTLEENQTEPLLDGTLVQPSVMVGLPCAAGQIFLGEQGASCVLAQGLVYQGFPLAGGSFAQINRADSKADWYLSQGTLAAAVTLFDAPFPAGTIVAPGGRTLAELAHSSADLSGITPVCLPAGAQLKLRGAVFHGNIQLAFSGEELQAEGTCIYHRDREAGPADGPRGYVELPDGKHIGMGDQEKPGAAWVEDEIYEGKGTY